MSDTPPEFAPGGLFTGPDGEDSVPVLLLPGERWYTAEEARQATRRPAE